jgi:molybdopterin converting factor small subunit
VSADGGVRVRILQLGRRVLEHVGGPGLTVAAAIEAVGLAAAEGMDLRVNGAPAEPATSLRDGDVVTLIPRIKGG